MRKLQIILIVMFLLLTGCDKKQEQFQVQYFEYFDTITSITVYADSKEQFQQIEEIIHQELEYDHQLFDIYENYEGISNVKTINDQAGIAPVEVEETIIELLLLAKDEYEKTDGMVDISMGEVLSVWHTYRDAGFAVPDLVTLEAANKSSLMDSIHIDQEAKTVWIDNEDTRIDVGAIAKGFAVEKLCQTLKDHGVTSALMSVGGNVRTIGTKVDGSSWRVGIQNPDLESDQAYVYAVKVDDRSMVTSGAYQRFYEVDGERYHHIVNPRTLYPSNAFVSVTILTPDSGNADSLSTAVFNLTLEEGMALIESMEDTECFWMLPDGSEVFSSGFEEYIDS